MGGRVLFVDDSGKPAARDSTRAVVIGGFSVGVDDCSGIESPDRRCQGSLFPGAGPPDGVGNQSEEDDSSEPLESSEEPRFRSRVGTHTRAA